MLKIVILLFTTTLIFVSYQNCSQVSLNKVAASQVPNFSMNIKYCNFEDFETKSVFAYNRNMKLEDGYYVVDTDGDGLSDELESDPEFQEKYGVNPRIRDSNLDGYDDLTVVKFDLDIDRQNSLPICGDTRLDSDRDGINDCTESIIMTTFDKPDSDNDGIPDRIEVSNGLNPIDNRDAYLDVDNDGIINLEEIKLGMPMHLSNEQFKNLEIITQFDVEMGTGCKYLRLHNVPFYEYLTPNQFTVEIIEQNSRSEIILRKINFYIDIDAFRAGEFNLDVGDLLIYEGDTTGDL